MKEDIVVIDIGGTHARFAIASLDGGRVAALTPAFVVKTSEHVTFESAWDAYAHSLDGLLPRAVAMAVAGPIDQPVLKLSNNPWVIRPAHLRERLGLEHLTVVNDFGAIAHAVGQLQAEHFGALCGPDVPLPVEGVISIVGPGTGLGVAMLVRRSGTNQVIETEGGHVDFAPVDAIDDAILQSLRKRHRRVSAERIISGSGLANIYAALAAKEGDALAIGDDVALWSKALDGEDRLAVAALDHFCLNLGSFAGDIALAHGSETVVIAGGLGQRLAARLPHSGFAQRFVAKGRFEDHLGTIPVRILTHPQPGLFGAAVAFAEERQSSTR